MEPYNREQDGTSPSLNNPYVDGGATAPPTNAQNGHRGEDPGGFRGDLERALVPEHLRAVVEESAISPAVAAGRGYRTVRTKAELGRLGFSGAQRRVPGLLVPVWGVNGDISTYQYRPDEPRIDNEGRPVKYETPRGSRMVLDVHPSMREKLGDPSAPLYLTEGIKKGDALVSRGLCTATLLGVWGFRGTNEHGGEVALPELEHVALNGRRVYVVFDSDVMLKHDVHGALVRIKGVLESRGAEVMPVYLPPGKGGKKQGADDFFAAGGTEEQLLSFATTELREPPRGDEEDEVPVVPYRITPHGLVWDKPTRDGTTPTPLTNFAAKIVGDVVEDDGAVQTRSFEIEAELNGRRSVFTVPAERFPGMGWVAEHLGAAALVYPGFGTKDQARAAVQMLSGDVPTRHAYAHTGWREIGDGWAYLHAGGAIASSEPLPEVEVSLGGRLGGYALPVPPAGEGLVRAIGVSLRFLELAPLRIAVPLFAAAYRAPLGEAVPVDLSAYLVGPTGVLKTELTAITQAHYGAAFNGRFLPANWSSTENALERLAFAAKDALLTVDDFAPTGTTSNVARLHRTADRFLRTAGNRSGRGRMRADTSLRAEYYPRGLVLSSGEDVPRGQSLKARILVVELSPGDVNLGVLTELQRAAAEGLLASAMSGYLR